MINIAVYLQPSHWWHAKEHAASNYYCTMKKTPGWWQLHPGGWRGRYPELTQAPIGPAAAAPTGIQVSSSAHVDSGARSAAFDAAQGEAATILAQGS